METILAGPGEVSRVSGKSHLYNIADFMVPITCVLVILRDLYAGPVRYYLDVYGVGALWYVADGMQILSIGAVTLSYKNIEKPIGFLIIFSYVFLECLIGLNNSESYSAVISGIKMLLPFFMGLSSHENVLRLFKSVYVLIVIYVVNIASVIYNSINPFEWENYSIVVGGVEKVASMGRWMEGGESRIAGFADDNAMAGFLILLLTYLLVRRVPLWMRVLIYGVSGYALYLTTSRTSLLSFAFMIAADLAIFLLRWGAGLRPGQATRIVFWVLAASPFVLPIASVIIFNNIDLRSVPTALYSYQDRATVTWVLPFQVLQEYFFPQGYFLGVGVGMAGYPMNFSDLSFLFVSYFDNFPLGTYLMFGVPGLIFLIQLILRTGVRCTSRSSLILCGLLLFYGTTIEGYGDATFCMILGGLISPNNRWNSSWA